MIASVADFLICIKPTSKVERYLADQELLAGVVYYEAGASPLFEVATAIQSDNQFPIPHNRLTTIEAEGKLEILGQLPADFKEKLTSAIRNSITMNETKQNRILSLLK